MKVYLSKASRAPFDIVNQVRAELQRRDLELVEATEPFTGHEKMLECDRVVFIPNSPRVHDAEDSIIGKGQADQLHAWLEGDKEYRPIIVTSEEKWGEVRLSEITEDAYYNNGDHRTVQIKSSTDYINYGTVQDDGDEWDFDKVFDGVIREAGPLKINMGDAQPGSIHLHAAVGMGII